MAFKDIRLKFKALGLKGFLERNDGRDDEKVKKQPWMTSISHGYHVDEDRSIGGESEDIKPDVIVVQREEVGSLELWFYGLFDATVDKDIARYMQSHLFNKNPQSHITRKSKETMRKAFLNVQAKYKEKAKEKTMSGVGSASVMVINGERLLIANMGDYKAVVVRDGRAHQLRASHQHKGKRLWPRRFISGAIHIPKVQIQACTSGKEAKRKQVNSSELVIASDKLDSETEFTILASTGVWEVIKMQEAVNLIRHIEDPKEAAECLAKEASIRRSRNGISCLVIKFD